MKRNACINAKWFVHFSILTLKDTCREKIQKTQTDISRLHISESELAALKAKVAEEEKSLSSVRASFSAPQLESKLKSLAVDLQSHEYQLSSINEEMSGLNQHSDTRARLGIKQNERERKLIAIKGIRETTGRVFNGILGKEFQPESLERDLSQVLLYVFLTRAHP